MPAWEDKNRTCSQSENPCTVSENYVLVLKPWQCQVSKHQRLAAGRDEVGEEEGEEKRQTKVAELIARVTEAEQPKESAYLCGTTDGVVR